jgi:hypothetical protein
LRGKVTDSDFDGLEESYSRLQKLKERALWSAGAIDEKAEAQRLVS